MLHHPFLMKIPFHIFLPEQFCLYWHIRSRRFIDETVFSERLNWILLEKFLPVFLMSQRSEVKYFHAG